MTENDLAYRICEEIRTGAPFRNHASEPPRTQDAAYALQDRVAGMLQRDAAFGPVAGWKIAANSAALLDRFGLAEPVSGRVFSGQKRDSPAMLRTGDYRQFALEPEIGAVMGETLAPQDAPFDAGQVKAAVARFVPAMELLDMRGVEMPKIHIWDAVAQNISNAGAVIGGPGSGAEALDPAAVRTVLTIDGEVRHDVTGAAPQHPLDAVMWLANHLARRGITLEAGQVVLCGTHSPIVYHDGPAEIVLDMSGLGRASLRLDQVPPP